MDREKVIKGLRDLRRYIEDMEWSDDREDRRAATDYWQAVTDAITLLKEHEAVKPVRDKKTGRIWLCGNCGSYVGFEDHDEDDPNEFDRFCRECGRPVLWEGR